MDGTTMPDETTKKSRCFFCGYRYPLTLNKRGFERFGHRFICFNCLVRLANGETLEKRTGKE